MLFNLFFDKIIAATLLAHPSFGVRMLFNLDGPLVGSRKKMRREVSIRDLEYVDNMALGSDSLDALEEILRTLYASCSGMGLKISLKKDKILAVFPTSSSSTPPRPVQLGRGGSL